MSRRREHRKEDNFDRVAEIARSAYRTASEIKDLVNVEAKRTTNAQTSTSVTSSGTILATVQSAISQGDDYNMRVGDSIKCQNLTLRWTGEIGATPVAARLRLIVFWDEGNLVTSANQILEYAGTAGQSVISAKQFDDRFLSKILYDKTMSMSKPVSGVGAYFPIREKVIKLDKHTQFAYGSTTVVTGALKILAISDHATANYVYVTYNAVMSYTDD